MLLFKQQFKASLEQFYIFNYAAEGQHEQIFGLHLLDPTVINKAHAFR